MRRFSTGLASKLAVSLAAGLMISFVGLGVYHLGTEKSHLISFQIDTANRISDLIKRSGRDYMLHNDYDGLHRLIQRMGSQPGLTKIRIINEDGIISYSTDAREMGTSVNSPEAFCVECHSGATATGADRPHPERLRIFKEADGSRVLTLVDPIRNEPACSGAPCHAHDPASEILGVLDTHISLSEADLHIRTVTRETVLWLVVTLLVVLGVSVGFVHFFVFVPVRQLHAATDRVAAGDLGQPIPVRSADELGALAESFNGMMEDLMTARRELQTWGEKLEEKVREKTDELESVHRHAVQMERMASVGRLAAIVAHEINNPLAGIRTYASLLKKRAVKDAADGDNKEQIEALSLIEGEAARCGEIVKNLLQYLRPVGMSVRPHDLAEVIQRSLRLVRHQMDLQSVELELEIEKDLSPVSCDGQQIQQALVAILINALQALGDGGRIRVSARMAGSRGGEAVEMTITDNGPGMDEETLERIFEPFFTTKDTGTGMGLGMAVVYGIVSRHHGRVEVESEPGKGTSVRIHLPVKAIEIGADS